MNTAPFLTDLDSRAAIKGSRDPLGLQPIWTRFGRYVVGNLTTVTTSVRDFTTLLLGYYFAERVAKEGQGESDLSVFLKWEQLAAYARGGVNQDWSFRGVERVKRNLSDGEKLSLGADSRSQILSDQKTYGLWGLYTVAARSSDLINGDPTRLSPAGRELIERVYLPIFSRGGFREAEQVVRLLAHPRAELDVSGKDRNLLRVIGKVLSPELVPAERDVYRRHLLLGGPQDRTIGCQAVLASALATTLKDSNWHLSPKYVHQLAIRCRKSQKSEVTAAWLERIRTVESILAPSAALFDFLLQRDEQSIVDVVLEMKNQWSKAFAGVDVDALTSEQKELCEAVGDNGAGARWVSIGKALQSANYKHAIINLLDQNRFVMSTRSGAAPWIELTNGRLRVHYQVSGSSSLPSKSELQDYWRHSYFLDSLRAMAQALKE